MSPKEKASQMHPLEWFNQKYVFKKLDRKPLMFLSQNPKIQIFNTGDTDLKNVRITDIFAENYSIIETGNGRLSENVISGLFLSYLLEVSKS